MGLVIGGRLLWVCATEGEQPTPSTTLVPYLALEAGTTLCTQQRDT